MTNSLKVSGSTLVEVIVALLIIMITFSAAMMIYVRVTTSSASSTAVRVAAEMESIVQRAEQLQDWGNEQVELDGITYTKTVADYRTFTDLKEIRVDAKQEGRQLNSIRRIVTVGHEQ